MYVVVFNPDEMTGTVSSYRVKMACQLEETHQENRGQWFYEEHGWIRITHVSVARANAKTPNHAGWA